MDVLRRAEIDCQMIGFGQEVIGSHGITVKSDQVWSGSLADFDGIVLPGGMPGAANLRDHDGLIQELKEAKDRREDLGSYLCCADCIRSSRSA